jgi:aconitate hydratase
LDGTEVFDIEGVETVKPRSHLNCKITRANGKTETIKLLCRIDTVDELAYFNNGGILHYVLRKLV